MLRALGADLVGMSMLLEMKAAAGVGLPVLGISAVTNFATGLQPEPLAHAEVIESGARAAGLCARLLPRILGRLQGLSRPAETSVSRDPHAPTARERSD